MQFRDIFNYSHLTVNSNGHPTYHDCTFLKTFGHWSKDEVVPLIHLFNNLFIYEDERSNKI